MTPYLVLVGGTHGAGKTTLAAHLSSLLNWPLLSRDHIRGGLAWTADEQAIEPAGDLSKRAVAVFFEAIGSFLAARLSVVAESTFRRGLSEDDLRPFLATADVRLVHCVVPRALAIERCSVRDGREFLGGMLEGRDEARWERVEKPLALPVPVLRVDTSDGYDPELPSIADFASHRDPRGT